MSHRGRQTITVTATNHYPHFTHLLYATHHETLGNLSLPRSPKPFHVNKNKAT